MAESILDIIFRTKKTGSGEKDTTSGLKGLSSAFENVTGVSLGWAGALALVGTGLRATISAASESQQVEAQLNATLESTKFAAGMSADELDRLAGKLSRLTAIDDELIMSGETLMLTFTRIGEDVFPEAMAAALDMSVKLDQDLKGSVIQLGKALNDPIQGITALRRVGVSFTDAQMDMIKQMVEANDVLGAQKLILEELNTEFGGSAQAAADTYAGKIKKLENNMGNLAEKAGNVLLPALTQATDALILMVEWNDAISGALIDNNDSVVAVSRSYEDYIAIQQAVYKNAGYILTVTDDQVRVTTNYGNGLRDVTDQFNVYNEAMYNAIVSGQQYGPTIEEMTGKTDNAATSMGGLAEQAKIARLETQEAAASADYMALVADHLATAETNLKTAQDDLATAQEAWKEGAGGQIAGMLEQAGLKGQDLYDVLAVVDEIQGTNEETTRRQKDEMQKLVDEYARTGDVEAFREGLQNLNDSFLPLNESVLKAQELVDELQQKVDTLEGVYYITIRARDETGGLGGGGGGGTPGGSYDSCFLGGTPVITPDGPRPIEAIQVGDLVSVLTRGGRIEVAAVSWRKSSRRADLVTVHTSDGQIITCSPNHPWNTAGNGWCWAAHLPAGVLLVSDHGPVWVERVDPYPGEHWIYNFTVDHEEHTFLVGGIQVHNIETKDSGGDIRAGRMYIVGGEGPELLQLDGGGNRAGHVYPNGQGTGAQVQISGPVYLNNGMDFEELMWRIAQRLGRL